MNEQVDTNVVVMTPQRRSGATTNEGRTPDLCRATTLLSASDENRYREEEG